MTTVAEAGQRLWQEYRGKRSSDARRSLIEGYAPLARYVVGRLNLTLGPALDHDDLLGQAAVGLIDAVDRFDPARGVKFETYACYRIRGAVMDMLRALDWSPRSIRQLERRMADAFAKLQDDFGRPPTDHEVAEQMGVTVERLTVAAHEVGLQAPYSLDESASPDGTEGETLGDSIADEQAPSPEKRAEGRAEQELLARAIGALTEAERTVVVRYYHKGHTLKEIGRAMGVTESRACQIRGHAVVRLRSSVQSLLALPQEPEERPGQRGRARGTRRQVAAAKAC